MNAAYEWRAFRFRRMSEELGFLGVSVFPTPFPYLEKYFVMIGIPCGRENCALSHVFEYLRQSSFLVLSVECISQSSRNDLFGREMMACRIFLQLRSVTPASFDSSIRVDSSAFFYEKCTLRFAFYFNRSGTQYVVYRLNLLRNIKQSFLLGKKVLFWFICVTMPTPWFPKHVITSAYTLVGSFSFVIIQPRLGFRIFRC